MKIWSPRRRKKKKRASVRPVAVLLLAGLMIPFLSRRLNGHSESKKALHRGLKINRLAPNEGP